MTNSEARPIAKPPQRDLAERVLTDLRSLFDPELARHLTLKFDDDGLALQFSGTNDGLGASVAIGREKGGKLSLMISGSVSMVLAPENDVVKKLPKSCIGIFNTLQLVPASEDQGEKSLIDVLSSASFDSRLSQRLEGKLVEDTESIDGLIEWTVGEGTNKVSIEVDHSFTGDRIPSRMVQLLMVAWHVPATGNSPDTVLSSLGKAVVRALNAAEKAKADAVATTSSRTDGEAQTVQTAEEVAAEAPMGGGAEEAAPKVREDPLPDPMETGYQAVAAVAPKSTKPKAKAGGLVGHAQGLITKAIDSATWTVGCGKELSGPIPKGLASSFKGKGPKDVKVEVDGRTVTFSFTWAMGGGFWIFGKRAVTWSASEKAEKTEKKS